MQIGGDIYSISEELCNIIYRVEIVNEYIKILQEAYQGAY